MTQRVLFCLIVLMVAGSMPSRAADGHDANDEDACRPDVFRLCASDIPDEDAIVACLNRRVASLSPACRQVIDPVSKRKTGARPPA